MSYPTYYWSAIVSIALSCSIFELFDVKKYRYLDPWSHCTNHLSHTQPVTGIWHISCATRPTLTLGADPVACSSTPTRQRQSGLAPSRSSPRWVRPTCLFIFVQVRSATIQQSAVVPPSWQWAVNEASCRQGVRGLLLPPAKTATDTPTRIGTEVTIRLL